MSTYTEHYNAKKPSKSENYDIDVANFNNDLWDEKIFEKQDKVVGKALSTNDFTNQYKNKLDSLKNYDDTEIKNNIEDIQIEQIEQDTKIQFLQTENLSLKSENERLREDLKGLPTSTFSGEVIDLNDSSEMRFQEFKVFGNSKQKEEPSPLHPSEVECCGDNVNIFDGECEMGNISTSTGQNTDSNEASRSKNYINIKNKDITIGIKDKTFNGTAGRLYFYKNDNTYISNVLINSLPFSTTTPSEATKVRFFLLNSVANINSKVKIEEGLTPTPYSKYEQGNINFEICNKNLLSSKFESGDLNSTTGYNENNTSRIRTKDYIKVKSNVTYTLSIDTTRLIEYDKNKKFIKCNFGQKTTKTDNETKFIKFSVNTTDIFLKVELEEGSSTSEYVEHQSQTYTIPTQQPFRKEGDYEDTFVKKNGKRYERHWINRYILDGSKKFVIGNPSNRFYLDINLNNLNYKAKSNYFKTGEENQFGVLGTVVLQTNRINLMANEFINANDFNDWILAQYNAGNPVYIDYILAEPEDIECTEEQNQILDKIENEAKTYKNITHIYSNDKISPKFEGTYNKDIEIMINNKATIVVESEV